jgi:hypothetical protein
MMYNYLLAEFPASAINQNLAVKVSLMVGYPILRKIVLPRWSGTNTAFRVECQGERVFPHAIGKIAYYPLTLTAPGTILGSDNFFWPGAVTAPMIFDEINFRIPGPPYVLDLFLINVGTATSLPMFFATAKEQEERVSIISNEDTEGQ